MIVEKEVTEVQHGNAQLLGTVHGIEVMNVRDMRSVPGPSDVDQHLTFVRWMGNAPPRDIP